MTSPCLTSLKPRPIRVLPSGLAGPYDGPDRPPSPVAPGEVSWLEPLPDAWISPPADDPAAVVVARESLRLGLIAGLQHLPARQRAILVLREVLAFSTAETTEILGTTTANGRPAAAVYHRVGDGALRADGAVALAPPASGVNLLARPDIW
ncbi:sigma factor-like helix-turn-helix DNA-binding protein [Streptomyces sp. Ru72]|uniref:sigma factor-like helix-turn-helix DNA-binding protein n=1 Tax=Streptomyces sp. Ru72 TaxID=2080747 RepID=UPI000D1C6250|nr:sigma factor-like helix-turn-helix DNA-binding protein [Streptomyces sp. Ru72]